MLEAFLKDFYFLGDIKILSQSHSFHPMTNQSTSLHPLTNQNSGNSQMQSLPDLTDMTSLRRPVTSMMTMSRQPEMIERMSPIQILFNDNGQYFVNFNLDSSNQQNK